MLTRQQALSKLTSTAGPFELATEESAGYPIRVFRNAPRSLRSVLEASRSYGDLPFLIDRDETLSYRQHYGQAATLARYLRAAGVKKGDRVALGMRNVPEWSVGFWACQAIGAIVVSLNAWWTGPELLYALADSEPVSLLVDGERLQRLRPYLGALDLRTMVVARRHDAGEGGTDFEAIIAQSSGANLPAVEIDPGDLATILYTSGTTGNPKGAAASHRNHVTNMTNSLLGAAAARMVGGLRPEAPAVTPENQPGSLQTFPFFHMGGFTGLLLGMANGGKLALLHKWSPAEALDLIERHRLTSIAGVPIVLRQLLDEAARSGSGLDSLTYISSGGAPVPPDLIERIGAQFSARIMPGNGYGLTETTGGVLINSGAEYLARPNSVGRPQATADIRVVCENGEEAPPGEVGEIWARGPNVIPGYWRNPDANAAAFVDGWFRSGDLGYVDEDGWYYVVDRKKDVIIRGGENVYCAEVEAALVAMPEVIDAAVLGLAHADYGEEVAAVLQVRTGPRQDDVAGTIRERLTDRLAKFKIPTVIEITETDLPRNATGKVLKNELRIQYFSQKTASEMR